MLKTLATAALVSGMAVSAHAATFSFTGNFEGDADSAIFEFVVGDSSDVTLRSYSYAGGTQADGNVVSAGGFDPILGLYDADGVLIEEYDDGPGPVPSDPVTGSEYDTNLTIGGLAAGTYFAAITQFDNFSLGALAAGFQETDPTFTSTNDCSNGIFCDVNGDNRTSFWAFDILGVESAEVDMGMVPLPASLPLLLAGMGALGLGRRFRRKA